MNGDQALTALTGALVGYALAQGLIRARLAAPPAALIRTNVNGRQIPAALGGPLCVAGLASLAGIAMASSLGWEPADTGRMGIAVAICTGVMAAAGAWDDRRGDERSRGFRGHLSAARSGSFTGGTLKLVAGAGAGLAAGSLVSSGRTILEVAMLVALAANLINLLDRAPGRAFKASGLIALPLIAFGSPGWTVASAGLLGALVAAASFDLAERAMLGDAGANPLGAVLGLGLAAALPEAYRVVALIVLVGLNLASERWSFSRSIETTPWLRAIDRWGRGSD